MRVIGMSIGSVTVDFATQDAVLGQISDALSGMPNRQLAVGSVNLDHLHHFRTRTDTVGEPPVNWLWLADGIPICLRGRLLTGCAWPRLTGADLLPEVLGVAERHRARVGWFGGSPAMHDDLGGVIAQRWPNLDAHEFWAPERADLADADLADGAAREVAAAQVDVLVVALGKPRQELWIEQYGPQTRASVLLAFGAAADFLAGRVTRAPGWMRQSGAEWLFRLSREPRRLSRRYLVQAPVELKPLLQATPIFE